MGLCSTRLGSLLSWCICHLSEQQLSADCLVPRVDCWNKGIPACVQCVEKQVYHICHNSQTQQMQCQPCHTPGLTLFVFNLTCITHMQLTGELPFEPSPTDERPIAPDWIPAENKERWEDYEAMLSPLDTWVSCQPSLSSSNTLCSQPHTLTFPCPAGILYTLVASCLFCHTLRFCITPQRFTSWVGVAPQYSPPS